MDPYSCCGLIRNGQTFPYSSIKVAQLLLMCEIKAIQENLELTSLFYS
jgi:hypothetical protein